MDAKEKEKTLHAFYMNKLFENMTAIMRERDHLACGCTEWRSDSSELAESLIFYYNIRLEGTL